MASELAEAKVTLVPTLVLHETFSRLDDPAVLRDTMLARCAGAGAGRAGTSPDMIRRAGWTEPGLPGVPAGRPKQDLFLRLFAAAGGRIAAGTDAVEPAARSRATASTARWSCWCGPGSRRGMPCWPRRGTAALLLGVDSLGLLAPGKAADLVVLTQDPLADIRNTLAIDRVMSRGLLLAADSLRKAW